jgi:hypothetical protein
VVPAKKKRELMVTLENCEMATRVWSSPSVRFETSAATKLLAALKSAGDSELEPSIKKAMSSVVRH